MIKQLPPDILIDIISRLPATSVVECKRVCKTWQTLLSDTKFPDIHLRRQLLQFDHGAAPKVGTGLLFRIEYKKPTYGYLLYYADYEEIINIDHKHNIYKTLTRINHPSIEGRWNVVGSCNGLICSSIDVEGIHDYSTLIFNPINKEYIHLPRFFSKTTGNQGYMVNGFGYIPTTNEYKVVRIFYKYSSPDVGYLQIYTLGSGNGWKDIGEITYLVERSYWDPNSVLMDGVLHWMDTEGNILAFDLLEEKFNFLPSPPCSYFKLSLLGGCLTAVDDTVEHLDIWQFKEQRNWIRAFRIEWRGRRSTRIDYYVPFALRDNGEVLLWDNGNILSCYDPKTGTVKELVDDFKVMRYFTTIHHMNSLVSLKALGESSLVGK